VIAIVIETLHPLNMPVVCMHLQSKTMIQQLSNIHDKVCMHKRTALYRAIKSREGQTKISGCRLGITHVNPVQAAIETGSEQ
jgi:hypothetical protein